ncbi:MFS transporter [Planctomycetes bacterium K23_9]|uniref:Major facilitator superfamily transporter n=1 Tax=Stieleria marina TaxID=1930275 RepID=A0A517NZ21_9BACT|nr:major facilitator superfamily transporter [Planctomycetes bacterium K23_9]
MAHYARWIEFLGGDLRQVGLVMGFGASLGLVLRPWIAQWMNRLGARTMWAIGYGVFAAAALSNLFLYELTPLIFVCRSGIVLGAAIVFTSGLTYVSQIAPDNRRAEAIGILGVGGFLGMLVGPFLGDLFLGSSDRQHRDFVWFFAIAAIANLIPAGILVFIRPPVRSKAVVSIRLSEFAANVRQHWPGTILLVDLAFGVCMCGPFIFVASFIDRQPLQISGYSVIGVFFWFYAGPAIAIRVFGRQLPQRWGTAKVLIAGGGLMSLGMFAFAVVGSENPWLIVLPALLAGAGHSLMFHTMTALTLETFPLEIRGTGSTLALMMLDLGTICGAPLLGLIGEQYGFATLFATIGATCFTATAVYWLSLIRSTKTGGSAAS